MRPLSSFALFLELPLCLCTLPFFFLIKKTSESDYCFFHNFCLIPPPDPTQTVSKIALQGLILTQENSWTHFLCLFYAWNHLCVSAFLRVSSCLIKELIWIILEPNLFLYSAPFPHPFSSPFLYCKLFLKSYPRFRE